MLHIAIICFTGLFFSSKSGLAQPLGPARLEGRALMSNTCVVWCSSYPVHDPGSPDELGSCTAPPLVTVAGGAPRCHARSALCRRGSPGVDAGRRAPAPSMHRGSQLRT